MYRKRFRITVTLLITAIVLEGSCSFDYGNQTVDDSTLPDIVMEDLDYVRVRSGSPQARFTAERAERYDRKRTMELSGLRFEQYNKATGELDAKGSAGSAEVELSSGNVTLKDGIDILLDTEDITLETDWLAWNDGERTLKGGEDAPVVIKQSGGTDFRGTGLSADVRSRQWEFSGGAEGAFEQDDDEDENNEDTADAASAEDNAFTTDD